VTNISKEERKALLEEFSRVSSKGKGKGKGKSTCKAKEKERLSLDTEMSLSGAVGSSKRKRILPGTGSKTVRSASKRAPAKRKPKRLEYLDQDSPQTSPTNRGGEECIAAEELSFVSSPSADTGLVKDHRQKEESSLKESLLIMSADLTCLDNGMDNELLEVRRKTGGSKLLERKSLHSLDKDQSQSLCLSIDGNSLVDRLFDDDQPVPSRKLPHSVAAANNYSAAAASKSAAPVLSSETCSPSVSIVGKVKLQSNNKSAQNTDLNIDELLFGF
jgi:hypothetical protein